MPSSLRRQFTMAFSCGSPPSGRSKWCLTKTKNKNKNKNKNGLQLRLATLKYAYVVPCKLRIWNISLVVYLLYKGTMLESFENVVPRQRHDPFRESERASNIETLNRKKHFPKRLQHSQCV
jgi:hypothetical protein